MEQAALHRFWPLANRKMVAKLLSELEYEQAFTLVEHEKAFIVTLFSGMQYQVEGWRNLWGQLVIEPSSIVRRNALNLDVPVEATGFIQDARGELGLSDESLAEHLEDLYATLLGDCKLMQRKADLTAEDIAALPLDKQQCLFDGHPKFAFNKGRRGWGRDDLRQFAPESEEAFQLYWIAVSDTLVSHAISDSVTWQTLLDSALSLDEQANIRADLTALKLNAHNYRLIPVHPWQWEKKLSLLFVAELAAKEMVFLGAYGDEFLPQLSLRTLTNVSRPGGYDIKLPLTIMNTSCYRGIPSRYVLAGPDASHWLAAQFAKDPTLGATGASILSEPASASVSHAVYQSLPNAPYRYHELCGVIWREAAHTKLKTDEDAILMAALMESDVEGNPLIGAYIAASGLSADEWISRMFQAVVTPLYHLLVKYGVSLIAHGQNITLVLENHAPKRILLKDFQGDMRLIDAALPELESLPLSVKSVTVRLPPELIIHDLQTGHFVTVLRFISPLMTQLGMSEFRFYSLLAQTLKTYMAAHPELAERFKSLDLFTPKMLRIGLNLAKFRHETDNSANRMLPDMDDDLDNPLYLVTH
ncbi:IucA/IucC family protein [Enterovibrio sp. 27052020O]|uniref:IucA/IucC family protein n=1 Tax=Enterovibrio sp. 27052020O TaxID=3241166 RepID=UPI0038910553